jgi:flagellar biosynthetic protein FliR
MNEWLAILLPFFLVLGRVLSFVAVLPLFSWQMMPNQILVAMGLLFTIFFAFVLPGPDMATMPVHWLSAGLLLSREILCGLGLGLACRLIFISVQQGIMMGTTQMGFADAGIIDPSTGTQARPMGMLFQLLFATLFLAANGHHLMMLVLRQSYRVFPVGEPIDLPVLAEGLTEASIAMLIFALKLAAPLLAGFLMLSVILGVIARVMPEMNILLASLPMRVGLGMVLGLAVLETIHGMVAEITDWIDMNLLTG